MPVKINTGGLKEFYYSKEDSERIEKDDPDVLEFKVALREHYEKLAWKKIVNKKILNFSLIIGIILIILVIILLIK